MINPDIASFETGDFRQLQTRVKGLLGNTRKAEFRLTEDLSVGIQRGIGSRKIAITLRDTEPYVHPDGYHLFHYKRLVVEKPVFDPVVFTETIGVLARNGSGILKDWKLRSGPRREHLFESNSPYEPRADLVPYFDPLDALSEDKRHDKYGRTQVEQLWEAQIVSDVQQETNRVLALTDGNELGQNATNIVYPAMRSRFMPVVVYHKYQRTLPTGEIVIVRSSKSTASQYKSTDVTIWQSEEEKVARGYKIRPSDGRLGVTRYTPGSKFYSNPATRAEGEEVLMKLQLIH